MGKDEKRENRAEYFKTGGVLCWYLKLINFQVLNTTSHFFNIGESEKIRHVLK